MGARPWHLYAGVASVEIVPSDLARLVANPDVPFEETQSVLIKAGRSAQIVRINLQTASGERQAAYKRIGSRTWTKRWLRGMRLSRARRNFNLAGELLRLQIPTARPLLAIAPRWWAFHQPCYLATEWIADAAPLDAFVRAVRSGVSGERQARLAAAARSLGHLIGSMHAQGVSHRDLKSANVLLRTRGANIEVFVIDLDGAARHRRVTMRMRTSNLARLLAASAALPEVTHALRLRMLRAYLQHFPGTGDWKPVWSQVRKKSRIPARADRGGGQ